MRLKLKRIALVTALAALSTQAAADMGTTSQVENAAAGVEPKALGSTTIDTVFTPITPCRVVDTRNVGGPIGAFATRNFFFYTTSAATNWNSIQGGVNGAAGTVCPGTVFTFNPTAAVATITVTGQGGAGNLIVWQGTNPVASASTMSYPAFGDTSSLATIPWGARTGAGPGGAVQDFGVFVNAFTATNVVVDIVGYYSSPGATALQCINTATNDTVVANGANFSANATNSCPATYTQVGINCLSATFATINLVGYGADNVGAFSASGDCQGINNSGGSITVHTSMRCCRVPGH